MYGNKKKDGVEVSRIPFFARSKKKGVMGIETLIIFIAMIIVAAIAAGVLLRTQGVLQQRALAVGTEARERIITGVEIISLLGYVDTEFATINKFEITIRPRAGSGDIQLKTLGLSFTTRDYFNQAVLQNNNLTNYGYEDIEFINGTPRESTYNYDYDPNDVDFDFVSAVFDENATDNLSGLIFNLSSGAYFEYSLGINFSTTGEAINFSQEPIYENASEEFSPIYGFLSLEGYTNGATGQIDMTTANLSEFRIESDRNDCAWDILVPDHRYCYSVRLGNANTIVEFGEILTLKYKINTDKAMSGDSQGTVQFIPKGGAIEEVVFLTPQVLSRNVLTLWP